MDKEEAKQILKEFTEIGLMGKSLGDFIQAVNITLQENEELKETLKCTQDSWFKDTQKLDKLQKENEEYKKLLDDRLWNEHVANLEKENETLKGIINKEHELNLDKRYVDLNFVSKDKIKDKIKELESHIWKDGYMTKFDKYAIHYLEDLLKEN